MKIIIIGDGKVGYYLAESLSADEANHVTIIDKDSDALKKAAEYLDVLCIRGNGLSTRILVEAGVRDTDLLIAVTTRDEMNMVCCLTAKKLGAKHTVARIRDPEYADELTQLKADLGLDMVINPEQATAGEITRMIEFPPAINIDLFTGGKVEMAQMRVTKGMSVADMKLKDISKVISSSVLIGGVLRGNEVIIPRGEFTIRENDTIYVIGGPAMVSRFCRRSGIAVSKIRNVMIVGGGRIALYLARYLNALDIKSKIVEINYERCLELGEMLEDSLVIHGDGTDESVLLSENYDDMGAFVALTDRDEENLIAAFQARHNGVDKVIAKVNRDTYEGAIASMGIENVVSPKLTTAEHILRYVRGLSNAQGNTVNSLYRIMDERVEAIEFTAGRSTKIIDIPLKRLPILDGILVAAIVRRGEAIIAHGNDVIKQGDNVILIAKDKKLIDLNDIVETGFTK